MFYHQRDWATGRVCTFKRFDPSGSLVSPPCISSNQARYTYSWRSKAPHGSFDPRGSTLGIRPPLSKGSVVDILRDRKRYIEEIATTSAGSRENGNYAGQTKRYASHDTGHPFTSVKWSGEPAYVERWDEDRRRSYLAYAGDAFVNGVAFVPPDVAIPGEFPAAPYSSGIPSALQRQDKINLMFHGMNPSKRRAQIGETLVSLMRGDLPTILKNVRQGIREGKKAYRSLGSEHLNVQFGWLPLIGDIQSAIEVLTTLDHLVYDGSNRRVRKYEWQTTVDTVANAVVRASRYALPGSGSSPTNYQVGVLGDQRAKRIVSTDVRLSARLTPITRRTMAANDFLSQAADTASQLGLWYPALGWDLLPYSWLVDWATNIGRSLENSLTYGSKPGQLNVDYAWATTKTVIHFQQMYFPVLSGYTRFMPLKPMAKELTTITNRVQGTPFGFGLSYDGLSAWQTSILVALGLAHAR